MKATFAYLGSGLSAVGAALFLSGCGGGGDLSDGVTDLTVSPNSATYVSAMPGVCPVGTGGRFFIYGGRSPYKVQNSLPAFMQVNPERVEHSGEAFDVTLLGGCIEGGIINVTDAVGRLVTVSITAQAKQGASQPE